MVEIVKLQCPSCAGKLEVAAGIDQFACAYCGIEVLVRRSGGTISLSPVVDGLKRVERGVDRTASELAMRRLEGELASLRAHMVARLDAKMYSTFLFSVGCFVGAVGVFLLFINAVVGMIPIIVGGILAATGWLGRKAKIKTIRELQAAVEQCEAELRRQREAAPIEQQRSVQLQCFARAGFRT